MVKPVSAKMRDQVRVRAFTQCEYCLLPQRFWAATYEVDHIIAIKHGGQTDLNNLAWSCDKCNRRKGTDLASISPETGNIVRLYHPRQDNWHTHFQINQRGEIVGSTDIGHTTAHFMRFNAAARASVRAQLFAHGLLLLPNS